MGLHSNACVLFLLSSPSQERRVKMTGVLFAGPFFKSNLLVSMGERGGSVVECRTPEREVRGSRPTSAVLCP